MPTILNSESNKKSDQILIDVGVKIIHSSSTSYKQLWLFLYFLTI